MLVDDLIKLVEKLTGKTVLLVNSHSYDNLGREVHTNVQIRRLAPEFKTFHEDEDGKLKAVFLVKAEHGYTAVFALLRDMEWCEVYAELICDSQEITHVSFIDNGEAAEITFKDVPAKKLDTKLASNSDFMKRAESDDTIYLFRQVKQVVPKSTNELYVI
jgi:hypothetical protein